MKLPITLSQSQINQFFNCPLSWYYEQIGRPVIFVVTSALDFGIGYHNVINTYYSKIDDFPTDAEIDEKLNEALVESGNYEIDSQKVKAKKIRDNFIKFEKNRVKRKEPKPTFTEKRLNYKIWDDLPEIVGKVDYYIQPLKKAVDFKTGKDNELRESHYIQGGLYMLLLSKNGYPVDELFFVNLDSGTTPLLPRITESWLHEKIKSMCYYIEHDYFPAKKSILCSWCSFQLSCSFRTRCIWI